ncbi:hypothetical protein NGRA_1510 [Nosema granulosis]|uniref:Uncharacterized protein n=1 Tax=Nosema granulosis TaxID=83296 RepID=A0A9P6KZ31_9MICR|nr:hypothetical protein NGRA_1510 [Nosema granulosis]
MIIRTNDNVTGMIRFMESFIVYGDNNLSFYDQSGWLIRSIIVNENLVNIKETKIHLVLITKTKIFIYQKDEILKSIENPESDFELKDIKKTIDKDNLDQLIVAENDFYLVKKDKIVRFHFPTFRKYVIESSFRLVCIGYVCVDGLYYIGFEDGSIKILNDKTNKVSESRIQIKKNITCFDKNLSMTAIGTFCKLILVFDSEENLKDKIYIENCPVKIKIWNEYICVLDSENNLILYSFDLRLFHARNYNGLLETFDILGNDICLIYTTGTIFKTDLLPQLFKDD